MAQLEKYNMTEARAIIAHVERTCKTHSNLSIDPTRTEDNYSLWPPDRPDQLEDKAAWPRLMKRLKEVERLDRPDVNVLCSWTMHLGVDVPPSYESRRAFYQAAVRVMSNIYGQQNVIYAWVHEDEEGSHIHFGFVPVVRKARKLRKNASEATKKAYEEAIAAGSTHVERVDADALINRRHLSAWHPYVALKMKDLLGYDPAIHTGITQALGGNQTVPQLKKKPPTWRENRNKQAKAFHAARKAGLEGKKPDLNDKITLSGPKVQSEPAASTEGTRSLSDILKNAHDRGGHDGW